MINQEKVDFVVESLNWHIESAQKTINTFKERLDTNPTYAFEWADAAFLAGAQIEYYTELKRVVEHQREQAASLTHEDVASIIEYLDHHFSRFLTDVRVSASTSGSHRLYSVARLEVVSEWFTTDGIGQRVNRKYMVNALANFLVG